MHSKGVIYLNTHIYLFSVSCATLSANSKLPPTVIHKATLAEEEGWTDTYNHIRTTVLPLQCLSRTSRSSHLMV